MINTDDAMILQRLLDALVIRGDASDKVLKDMQQIESNIVDCVGDNISLKDAVSLSNLGFFISHRNFSKDESMHGYGGKVYYEDGACLNTSGIIEHPLEWMEEGWYIKARPTEVDFTKLYKMHKDSKGLMICGQSYEECLKVT